MKENANQRTNPLVIGSREWRNDGKMTNVIEENKTKSESKVVVKMTLSEDEGEDEPGDLVGSN